MIRQVIIPPGFVRCHGRFSDYFINKHGVVLDSRTGREASRSIDNRTGYVTVIVHLTGGLTTVTYLHRLLAIAFVPNNTGRKIEEIDVNHINRNRQDNRIENLEWVTRKNNVIHAYRTGARNDNVWMELHPVPFTEAFRSTGGEPLFFYSLSETARFLGCNPATLCEYLKKHAEDGAPYHDWYISYMDNRAWFEYDSGDMEDPYNQFGPKAEHQGIQFGMQVKSPSTAM